MSSKMYSPRGIWKHILYPERDLKRIRETSLYGVALLMQNREEWVGSANDLLKELRKIVPAAKKYELPTMPNALSRALKDGIDTLNRNGIDVFKKHSGTRTMRITKIKGDSKMTKSAKTTKIEAVLETLTVMGPISVADISELTSTAPNTVHAAILSLRKSGHNIVGNSTSAKGKALQYSIVGEEPAVKPKITPTRPLKPQPTATKEKVPVFQNELVNRAYHLVLALRRCTIEDFCDHLDVNEDVAERLMVTVSKQFKSEIKMNISLQCK